MSGTIWLVTYDVRPLGPSDVAALLDLLAVIHQESGTDGVPINTPMGESDRPDRAVHRRSLIDQWSRELSDVHWMRAWGAWVDGELVGQILVEGGPVHTAVHRARFGMGVRQSYWGVGIGGALLDAAVAWATDQAELDWLDLSVFSLNAAARSLYASRGFEEMGVRVDAFRIDGQSIDDIEMTRPVRS